MQEGWHVGQLHRCNLNPVLTQFLAVFGDHESSRYFHSHHTFGFWLDETFLDGDGDRSNRAVPTHRKATTCFDEQYRHIILRILRRIKHASAHQVVPARLEPQPGANPVILPKE